MAITPYLFSPSLSWFCFETAPEIAIFLEVWIWIDPDLDRCAQFALLSLCFVLGCVESIRNLNSILLPSFTVVFLLLLVHPAIQVFVFDNYLRLVCPDFSQTCRSFSFSSSEECCLLVVGRTFMLMHLYWLLHFSPSLFSILCSPDVIELNRASRSVHLSSCLDLCSQRTSPAMCRTVSGYFRRQYLVVFL